MGTIIDHVYGSDTVPVDISSIVKAMASPQLVGKPKLLLLQACQGKDLQTAIKIPATRKLAHDGPASAGTDPIYGDFCICKSTIPGFVAYRHEEDGSWFIQTLCKTIEAYADW